MHSLTLGLILTPAPVLLDDFSIHAATEASLSAMPHPLSLLEVEIKGELATKWVNNFPHDLFGFNDLFKSIKSAVLVSLPIS